MWHLIYFRIWWLYNMIGVTNSFVEDSDNKNYIYNIYIYKITCQFSKFRCRSHVLFSHEETNKSGCRIKDVCLLLGGRLSACGTILADSSFKWRWHHKPQNFNASSKLGKGCDLTTGKRNPYVTQDAKVFILVDTNLNYLCCFWASTNFTSSTMDH